MNWIVDLACPTTWTTLSPVTTMFKRIYLFFFFFFFFFNDRAPTEIYPFSLHAALPIWSVSSSLTIPPMPSMSTERKTFNARTRSEEHTSELQSRLHLVCRLLLEKK